MPEPGILKALLLSKARVKLVCRPMSAAKRNAQPIHKVKWHLKDNELHNAMAAHNI